MKNPLKNTNRDLAYEALLRVTQADEDAVMMVRGDYYRKWGHDVYDTHIRQGMRQDALGLAAAADTTPDAGGLPTAETTRTGEPFTPLLTDEMIEALLVKFDYRDACAILKKIGGFYPWTPEEMKVRITQYIRRFQKEPCLISTSTGGIRAVRDKFGNVEVCLSIYGVEVKLDGEARLI